MASTIKSDNGVSSGVTGIVQTADSSGQLALQTTSSGGSAVTALTIDNSQKVTFANSIAFGSNQGIIFNPSTQGSGHTSNTLTDYEEGTWTPILAGSASGSYVAGGGNYGWYRKVGNVVHVGGTLNWTSLSSALSGNLCISGLPFTSASGSATRSWGSFGVTPGSVVSSSSTYTMLQLTIDGGASAIYIIAQNSTGNYTQLPSSFSITTSGSVYGFGATYIATF